MQLENKIIPNVIAKDEVLKQSQKEIARFIPTDVIEIASLMLAMTNHCKVD